MNTVKEEEERESLENPPEGKPKDLWAEIAALLAQTRFARF